MNIYKASVLCAFTAFAMMSVAAQEPDGYYSSCEGYSGATLLTKLESAISSHTNVGYDCLWDVYDVSDIDENGKIWDIYSTKRWTSGQEHCGNYSNVGDCINREHTVPQSWFNEAQPMKSDAFHVYPTDGKVNGQRSNYPYGECENGTNLGTYDGVTALGKLGTCTFSGYTGKVFEPDDEYKGDIARSYFYMAACYNDRISSWSGEMFDSNSYPGFTTWTLNLLLKWHRQDPVSQKEIDRNNGIYTFQGNRNPFIDHPELVEYVWGDKTDTAWYIDTTVNPAFTLPVDGSTVSFGTVATSSQASVTVTVKATALTEAVTASVDNSAVTLSRTSISADDACQSDGTSLTINWNPAAAGSLSATLTLTSGDAGTSVTLTGTAVDGLPVLSASNVTPTSFTARWIYVGNADAHDCYALHVLDASNAELSGYPVDVTAAAEEYTVENLTPVTTYSYYLVSACETSDVMSVTTGELIPSIEAMIDNYNLTAVPDQPSAESIIDLEIENITDDLEATVKAPFQISTDRTNWSTYVTFAATVNTLYVRLGATSIGEYESSVVISGGGIINDDITLTGTVATVPDNGLTYFVADGYELDEDVDDDAAVVTLYNPGKTTTANNTVSDSNRPNTLFAEGYSHSSQFATITFSEGTNTSNGPVVWYSSGNASGHVRMYTGNSFTITPVAGSYVAEVQIRSNNTKTFTVGDVTLDLSDNVSTYTGTTTGAITFTATGSTRPYCIIVSTVSDSSGIEDVKAVEDDAAVYYDLRGIPVERPQQGGVYIKVTDSGAQKVVF